MKVFFLMCAVALLVFPNASQAQYVCDIPTNPPAEVRKVFAEYFECTSELLDPWLASHPEDVQQLEVLYQAWKANRSHDLRGSKIAANWTRSYPVKFSDPKVELTTAQVEVFQPIQDSDPVLVKGSFERLFVDRSNKRLFLTSEEEGLVSINIAKRYAFEKEGNVGKAGAKDFFVLNATTAVLEEPNPRGGNRDLVVLDIADRQNPKEIARLVAAIPEVKGTPGPRYDTSNVPTRTRLVRENERAPTFDQYRRVREGILSVPSCGAYPFSPQQPDVKCRPDGTCYKEENRKTAEAGTCSVVSQPQGPIRTGVVIDSSIPRGAMPEKTSEGGAGGAGSLSQMMVQGETLYVLSAAEGIRLGWLTSFDLSDRRSPKVTHIIEVNNGPEALQRHDNLLLIAGRDAVITASLSIEKKPRLLGELRENCRASFDPIVVQGSIGYRTIIQRQRSNCTSRLEVIDLSRPHQPILRQTVRLSQPRGLAVMGRRLFVAEQNVGIKIFDITDEVMPFEIGTWDIVGVKDLVLSNFDLYALSGDEIQTFFVGSLYQKDPTEKFSVLDEFLLSALQCDRIKGVTTVKRK